MKQPTYLSPSLQLIFVISAVLSIIAELPLMIHFLLQPNHGPGLGGIVAFMLTTILTPMLYFAIAYAFGRKQISWKRKVFESTLLAMSAVLLISFFEQILNFLYVFTASHQASWLTSNYAYYVIPAVVGIAYIALLWWLKRTKRWA